MISPVLKTYLEGVEPATAPLVVALDEAVRNAHPEFDVAVKYGILMYALGGDWRTWVCAIGTKKRGVSLRFLFGVLLEDRRRVLRAGTSILMTWDFAVTDDVDPAAVGAYVAEAVTRYEYYKANSNEVLQRSRAAVKEGRKPKFGG